VRSPCKNSVTLNPNFSTLTRTGPDQTYTANIVLQQVWSVSNSTTRARPDRRRQIGDFSHLSLTWCDPTHKPDLFQQDGKCKNVGRKIIVAACTAAIASSFRCSKFVSIDRKRRHSIHMGQEIHTCMAENSVENLLL